MLQFRTIQRPFDAAGCLDSWATAVARSAQPKATEVRRTAPYAVQESEDGLLLNVDLPGVAKENIEIEVTANSLKVSGVRDHYGHFERNFTLSDVVDSSAIEAKYENGVLILALPKKPVIKPRKIGIGDSITSPFAAEILHKPQDKLDTTKN